MKLPLLGLLAACALTAACSSGSDTTTTSLPLTPTAPLVTENFTGTVQVGGSDANPFTITTSGSTINLTLTTVGPPSTIYMGFGVGSPVGASCQLLTNGYTVTQAGTTPQLTGTIGSGQYCVVVYDAGNMLAPVTYAVTVTHY